jgi:hypothetical protein
MPCKWIKIDVTLRIAPVAFEIAPGKTIHTYGYNGQIPGPLLRVKAGIPFTGDVFNDTDHAEIVHCHGQVISATADGSIEEGSPPVPPHGHRRYGFRPGPAGTRRVVVARITGSIPWEKRVQPGSRPQPAGRGGRYSGFLDSATQRTRAKAMMVSPRAPLASSSCFSRSASRLSGSGCISQAAISSSDAPS